MATENTDFSWFWYIRPLGKKWVLGLVDQNGDAITVDDLDIQYWYGKVPDEVTGDDDEIPIPAQFEHGFAMGCVYELMRMLGKDKRSYKQDFEQIIYDARHTVIEASSQPLTIAPIDMRKDMQRIRTKQREA